MLGRAPAPAAAGHKPAATELTDAESALLARYMTNVDRAVFALRNLPEVVKGALFSRYSRTEKSLRRVLLDEFLNVPQLGLGDPTAKPEADSLVDQGQAEDFYERVLVGYGDDSVAELAGAHLAVEKVSMLAAKAIEDSRIGISPLEKSTRYVRFDRRDPDGGFLYYRGRELDHSLYPTTMDGLFQTYSELLLPLTERIRQAYPIEAGETERAWKSATRAKALDLLRGLLPAGSLTNLGLYGNGRAFEYLVTKLASRRELQECRDLAAALHRELQVVMPAFVRRALDERYGEPAARLMNHTFKAVRQLALNLQPAPPETRVRLVESDPDAEMKVVAAALFPHSDVPLQELQDSTIDPANVLDALLGGRQNRRHRAPRPLEHAHYTFEIVANFAAYRDLQRHRMLTQDRQLLTISLGYDQPHDLEEFGAAARFKEAIERAQAAYPSLVAQLGPDLAQYAVPMAFHVRWYFRLSLRELYHLCELRTTPQGHPDYRLVAQEMFKLVAAEHPRLASYARFVDMGPGDELERRQSERKIDAKLKELG
jgi:thymidylate synthase ThyX